MIPGRVGLTASKGTWPRRLLCALRGHRWQEFDGYVRFRIDGPWRTAKSSDPIVRCAFCRAQVPWDSDPLTYAGTLDFDRLTVVPRKGSE